MDGTAIEVVLSRRLTAPQCRTIHHKSMFARCVGLVGAHMFVYVVYIGYFNLDYIYIYMLVPGNLDQVFEFGKAGGEASRCACM